MRRGQTGTASTIHMAPWRAKKYAQKLEGERNAGTTGGPVTIRQATPEELAALRAERDAS